jgi:hydrogenase maturation factor HypF (carbamoyltransferase family)
MHSNINKKIFNLKKRINNVKIYVDSADFKYLKLIINDSGTTTELYNFLKANKKTLVTHIDIIKVKVFQLTSLVSKFYFFKAIYRLYSIIDADLKLCEKCKDEMEQVSNSSIKYSSNNNQFIN